MNLGWSRLSRAHELLAKGLSALRWTPALCWQQLSRRHPRRGPVHLIVAIADHFEPSIVPGVPGSYASQDEQERRLEDWCQEYPKALDRYRDADGQPLRHTYFFPVEQYERPLVERLADHCRAGWGEVEIHLHHGTYVPDTAENTRKTLIGFRDILAGHGCLSRWEGQGGPQYAFVHGMFALANSLGGRHCGVDGEMQILADTGCYGDFTLPSAPSAAQTAKINSLYECALPLDRKAPHRRGRDLRRGRPPGVFPLIVQGPLSLRPRASRGRWFPPRIENGELAITTPPTLERLRIWQQVGVTVKGRPDWIYVKLHCHGMDPRDRSALVGPLMQRFLEELSVGWHPGGSQLHFVTAREMVNIILAACDGREGNPRDFRDYRLRLISKS